VRVHLFLVGWCFNFRFVRLHLKRRLEPTPHKLQGLSRAAGLGVLSLCCIGPCCGPMPIPLFDILTLVATAALAPLTSQAKLIFNDDFSVDDYPCSDLHNLFSHVF